MTMRSATEAKPTLWAIYTRESTEGQLEGKSYNSHHSQEDYLRNFVKAQGGEVYAAYSDTQSGTKLDSREGLLRLLADAQLDASNALLRTTSTAGAGASTFSRS